MAAIEKFIKVDDIETCLRMEGSGQPILFLHGLGMAGWMPIHEELAKNYTVYAPDHPGFGRSSVPEWFDSMEDLVIHYARLLDELKPGPINLIGHSLGGWVAAELAAFYPERVRKLVLIDAFGMRVAGSLTKDLFAYPPELLKELCFVDPKNATGLMEDLTEDYRERATLARLMWTRNYNPKLQQRLRRFKAPSLIIWGREDRLVPSAHARAYSNAIADAQLELLENCGHVPIIERVLDSAKLICDFLAKEEN